MGLKESGLRGSLRNVSVGIGAIPDGRVVRDEDDGATTDDGKNGIKISVGSDYPEHEEIGCKLSANVDGVTRSQVIELDDDDNIVEIIDTQDISGLSAGDEFVFEAKLEQNTTYSVVADDNGENYTQGFFGDDNFPYSGDIDIDIVGGSQGDGSLDANNPSNILGVGDFGFD